MTRDVLLVHGLWMKGAVMLPLARRLARAGFRTHTLSYASLGGGLDDHVEKLRRAVEALGAPHVCIVAHSMGGIVTLHYLARARMPTARVVLLGSPVSGCLAGRTLAAHGLWRTVLGRSAELWETWHGLMLPDHAEVGAIAGTGRVGIGRFFVDLPEPNDGAVMVSETRMPGLAAHIVLPVSHSAMLLSPEVAQETAHFLRSGRFRRAA